MLTADQAEVSCRALVSPVSSQTFRFFLHGVCTCTGGFQRGQRRHPETAAVSGSGSNCDALHFFFEDGRKSGAGLDRQLSGLARQSSSFEAMATYRGGELPVTPSGTAEYARTSRVDAEFFRVFAVARLKPDVSLEQTQAELTAIAAGLERQYSREQQRARRRRDAPAGCAGWRCASHSLPFAGWTGVVTSPARHAVDLLDASPPHQLGPDRL